MSRQAPPLPPAPEPKKEAPQYRGNHVPFFIKIVWAVLFLWGVYYLFSFAWPDFRSWRP